MGTERSKFGVARLMPRMIFSRRRIALPLKKWSAGFYPKRRSGLLWTLTTSRWPFMLIDHGHMEALFVDPACQGSGVGAALVRHGLTLHPKMTTDVNEQNGEAIGFYEKMGFRRTGRSPLDGQGRPYPLVHLQYGE